MTPMQLTVLQCFLPDLFCTGLGQGGVFSDSGSASTGEMWNKQREDGDIINSLTF